MKHEYYEIIKILNLSKVKSYFYEIGPKKRKTIHQVHKKRTRNNFSTPEMTKKPKNISIKKPQT